jgi:DNA-binding winged helix-turn-helix (wHTH) protein/tetratricopeptide (TPR) repeat protein
MAFMATSEKPAYEFGPFLLDTDQRILLEEGAQRRLGHKAFDLLTVLVENRGRITAKDTLLKSVWPDTFVEEGVLTTNISQLRKVLGEGYIETHHGTGYRFIKPVRVIKQGAEDKNEEEHQGKTYLIQERITGRVIIEPTEQRSEALTTVGPADHLVPRQNFLIRALATYRRRPMLVIVFVLAIAMVSALYFLVPGPKTVKSIAVLPFRMGGDDSNQSFGLGLTADCIRQIGTLKQIKVRPAEDVLKYMDRDLSPVAAGRELGVDTVLSGKIWIRGERVTAIVELWRVEGETRLWTRTFDKKLTDLINNGEDSIHEQVARQLRIKLTPDETKRLEQGGTEDTDAYNLYLSGRSLLTRKEWIKALAEFKAAASKDESFALALAGEAECHAVLGSSGYDSPPRENLLQAEEEANVAIRLDGSLAEAHVSLGLVHLFYYWNREAAGKELQQALELNPSCQTAHNWYAVYLTAAGEPEQAIEEARSSEESDPSSPQMSIGLARALYYDKRYDEAIKQCNKALERFPDSSQAQSQAHLILGSCFEQKQEYPEAINEFLLYGNDNNEAPMFLTSLGTAYAWQGDKPDAIAILERLEHPPTGTYVSPTYTATIYTALGDPGKAFGLLNRACERDYRASEMIFLEIEPTLFSLHNDPRFKELLARVGTPLVPGR